MLADHQAQAPKGHCAQAAWPWHLAHCLCMFTIKLWSQAGEKNSNLIWQSQFHLSTAESREQTKCSALRIKCSVYYIHLRLHLGNSEFKASWSTEFQARAIHSETETLCVSGVGGGVRGSDRGRNWKPMCDDMAGKFWQLEFHLHSMQWGRSLKAVLWLPHTLTCPHRIEFKGLANS